MLTWSSADADQESILQIYRADTNQI